MVASPEYLNVAHEVPPATATPRRWPNYVFGLLLLTACAYVLARYRTAMDAYEVGILIGAAAGLAWLTARFSALKPFVLVVAAMSLLALYLYSGNPALGEQRFVLKYLLASQSAIMWMSALFVLATVSYLAHLLLRLEFAGAVATGTTWTAAAMGLTGLLVRWYESYLISPEIGHIPVSNLYEVFILFCI